MSGSVLYISAIGVASGIVIRSLFHFGIGVSLIVCVSIIFCVCILYFVLHAPRKFLYGMLVFCISVFVGVWRYDTMFRSFEKTTQALSSFEEKKIVLHGTIVRDVEDRDGEQVLVVQAAVESGDVKNTLVRVTTQNIQPFAYGDVVVVKGVLKTPDSFETNTARTFLYKEYLETQGVTHTISFASVGKTTEGSFSFLRALYASKRFFVDHLTMVLPEPQAGFAAGLLLGEKRAMGSELEDIFRTVGIVHIVVLSGYNLTIVAESIMRLLSFVFLPRTRTILGVCSLCIFAVMVGLSATVLRAACMAVLVLVARAFGRTSTALRGLSIAALGMLVWNPCVLLYDPGFQLSFLATLGLIVVSPLLEDWVGWVPTRFQIREYVTSTMATQIFVTPFLLYAMGNVSLVALFANVLILSAVPLSMLLSLVAGIAGIVFGSSALYLGFPAYALLSYMLFVAGTLARVPFASIEIPPFSVWYMVMLYVCMGVFLFWYTQHKKTSSAP